MPLEELLRLFAILHKRIEKHGPLLRRSEALTRYVLIDPLLRALGWDTEDPEQVRPEYPVGGGSADYGLMDDGKPLLFIEAKKLGEPVEAGLDQGIQRCIHAGTRFFAVTNGAQWDLYDTAKIAPIAERRGVTFDLTTGPLHEVVLKALSLWKPKLVGGMTKLSQTKSPSVSEPTPQRSPLHEPPGWISLSKLEAEPKKKPPSRLRLSDGTERSVGSWAQLCIEIVGWLVEQGILTTRHCPIQRPGRSSKNFISAQGVEAYGSWTRVGPLCVDTKYNNPQQLENVRFLLDKLGQNPEQFWVIFNPQWVNPVKTRSEQLQQKPKKKKRKKKGKKWKSPRLTGQSKSVWTVQGGLPGLGKRQ